MDSEYHPPVERRGILVPGAGSSCVSGCARSVGPRMTTWGTVGKTVGLAFVFEATAFCRLDWWLITIRT